MKERAKKDKETMMIDTNRAKQRIKKEIHLWMLWCKILKRKLEIGCYLSGIQELAVNKGLYPSDS